jgi:hypothetical protein
VPGRCAQALDGGAYDAVRLDDQTERIIKYLNRRDIPINAFFFQVFENGSERLLSRAWIIDPIETQGTSATGQA